MKDNQWSTLPMMLMKHFTCPLEWSLMEVIYFKSNLEGYQLTLTNLNNDSCLKNRGQLLRILNQLVAKGWIIKTPLGKTGKHHKYSLNRAVFDEWINKVSNDTSNDKKVRCRTSDTPKEVRCRTSEKSDAGLSKVRCRTVQIIPDNQSTENVQSIDNQKKWEVEPKEDLAKQEMLQRIQASHNDFKEYGVMKSPSLEKLPDGLGSGYGNSAKPVDVKTPEDSFAKVFPDWVKKKPTNSGTP